jgi:hypothetical protein
MLETILYSLQLHQQEAVVEHLAQTMRPLLLAGLVVEVLMIGQAQEQVVRGQRELLIKDSLVVLGQFRLNKVAVAVELVL